MFFNPETGEINIQGRKDCLWIADDYIFFSTGNAEVSVRIEKPDRNNFLQFIERAAKTSEYVEYQGVLLYAFEQVDEGFRNWCFVGDPYFIYVIKQDVLSALRTFLENQWKDGN